VIVQKDKITAANCFLPLTINPALSSTFGTRHRAAIGITEETDCLSLVVSEETGRISVAASGELATGLNLREVDRRICTHFGVRHAAARLIEDFAADIPMENHPAEGTEPK
jgi:diadenylate cyclase